MIPSREPVCASAAPLTQPRPRSGPSPYVVRDNEGKPKYGGALLKIGETFYLDADTFALTGIEMPMIEVAGQRVYAKPLPPKMANIVGAYFHCLAGSATASISTVEDLAERLAKVGLTRKSLGGRDEQPLGDVVTRFWFGEVRHVTGLPLTRRAVEDSKRGMGFARSREQLQAELEERRSRWRSMQRAADGADQLLEHHAKTGDWSSWRKSFGAGWSEDDKKVADALIATMDGGRYTAEELAVIAAGADKRERKWGDQNIREFFNRMRSEGAPIASTTAKPAGSWIEENPADYRKWLNGFKNRQEEIFQGGCAVAEAAKLWFPESAQDQADAAKFLSTPIKPSKKAVERLNRIHETEAKKRQTSAERKQAKMDEARLKRDRLQATPKFQDAFDAIEKRGETGTQEQREILAEWKALNETIKGKRAPRKSNGGTRKSGGRRPAAAKGRRSKAKSSSTGGANSGSDAEVGKMPLPW